MEERSGRHPRTVERDDGTSRVALCRSALPPLRARLHHEPLGDVHGLPTIALSPCPLATAIRAAIAAAPAASSTLLVDALRSTSLRRERRHGDMRLRLERTRLSSSATTDDAGLGALEVHAHRRWTIARIDGPIEASDAVALERALHGGTPLLFAELRAALVLQTSPWASTWVQCRDHAIARTFAAVAVTRYIGMVLKLPTEALPPLPSDLLADVRGDWTIRPHEVRLRGPRVFVRVRSASGACVRLVADRAIGTWR
jgi:hypothetical protein